MLGQKLITKQTGEDGLPCDKVHPTYRHFACRYRKYTQATRLGTECKPSYSHLVTEYAHAYTQQQTLALQENSPQSNVSQSQDRVLSVLFALSRSGTTTGSAVVVSKIYCVHKVQLVRITWLEARVHLFRLVIRMCVIVFWCFLSVCCWFAAGAADGAHVHAQGDVLVDHDGPGITGQFPCFRCSSRL